MIASKGKQKHWRNCQTGNKGVRKQNEILPSKTGKESKQQVAIEDWQEQKGEVSRRGYLPTEDARVEIMPKWSDIGSEKKKTPASIRDSKSPEKDGPQQPIGKAPPCFMRPAALDYTRCNSGCAQPRIEESVSPVAKSSRIGYFGEGFLKDSTLEQQHQR